MSSYGSYEFNAPQQSSPMPAPCHGLKDFKPKEPEFGLQGCGFHHPKVRKPLACSLRLQSAPARVAKIPKVRFAEESYSQCKQQQQTTTTYFISSNSPHASFKRFSTSAAAVSKICRVSGTDTSISGPSGPSGKYASWAHSISRNASKIWVSSQSERCMPQCSTLPCCHVHSMSKPFQPHVLPWCQAHFGIWQHAQLLQSMHCFIGQANSRLRFELDLVAIFPEMVATGHSKNNIHSSSSLSLLGLPLPTFPCFSRYFLMVGRISNIEPQLGLAFVLLLNPGDCFRKKKRDHRLDT